MEQLSSLSAGNPSINLDEIKKQYGDPPWAHRVVMTGQISGVVICQAPGHPNDKHYHIYDEWWLVMEGEITWEIEGESEAVRAKAGDFVLAPKNCYHLISIVGDKPAIRLAISVTGEEHRFDK